MQGCILTKIYDEKKNLNVLNFNDYESLPLNFFEYAFYPPLSVKNSNLIKRARTAEMNSLLL